MSIHEKSALEHIDLKTAAYNVTQEIKGHKDLNLCRMRLNRNGKSWRLVQKHSHRYRLMSTVAKLLSGGVTEAQILQSARFAEWVDRWPIIF
jgi:hypothetical protein